MPTHVVDKNRSAVQFTFKNQPHGRPIKGQEPTNFQDALLDELLHVLHREDNNLVYRGDIKLRESCVVTAQVLPWDSEDTLDSDCAITLSPSMGALFLPPLSLPPSSPMEGMGASSLPPSSPRPISPMEGTSDARSPSPDIFGLPRKIVTYTTASRSRWLSAARTVAEKAIGESSVESKSTKSSKSRMRKIYPARSRQSAHLATTGEYSLEGMTLTQVSRLRIVLYASSADQFPPIVDTNNRVVGAHVGAPLSTIIWPQLISYATKLMRRLHLNGKFKNDASIRVGIDFGVLGPGPHNVENIPINTCKAQQQLRVQGNHGLPKPEPAPGLPGSVFTTAEFSFANPSAVMTRTTGDQFRSWCAITTFSDYGDDSAWFFYWPEEEGDRFVIACPPGTTLVVPASIVRSSFSALKKGETCFIFQQYFNVAVGRWVENGFKLDSDFEGGGFDFGVGDLGDSSPVSSRPQSLGEVVRCK
ncbi:hypothetical protein B0H14DRAFT_2636739 [Mycena olivaceomarginata]|nr:hypothetical protein B0H14DRAFT_2636739 [Mycena olivaceomarginata]